MMTTPAAKVMIPSGSLTDLQPKDGEAKSKTFVAIVTKDNVKYVMKNVSNTL